MDYRLPPTGSNNWDGLVHQSAPVTTTGVRWSGGVGVGRALDDGSGYLGTDARD